FIAERIITYGNPNENPGILFTKRDFQLQTGNLDYKTGFLFTNRESWTTNGILGLLFTIALDFLYFMRYICNVKSEIYHINKGRIFL
ncbi:hypothetical protein D5278_20115, partial [bacterium 1XD21-13]|nr:hypothetical protein [bacterium 1XD21-13]